MSLSHNILAIANHLLDLEASHDSLNTLRYMPIIIFSQLVLIVLVLFGNVYPKFILLGCYVEENRSYMAGQVLRELNFYGF